ncbi:MAG: hypothetical protein AB7N53_15435 [Candidatus Binatia bacterium]
MHDETREDGPSAAWPLTFRWAHLADWLLRHPLALALPVQAALLLTDLARLPIWGDEQSSLTRASSTLDALLRALATNVHPVLYFVSLRAWLSLPCPAEPLVCARALSVLFLLAATILVDRCWLRGLDPASRAWFLALWALSPALLLYGRMARSYSLQLLLGTAAVFMGQRLVERRSAATVLGFAAAAVALLHTHYLPGLAVVSAVTALMLWTALRARDARAAGALAIALAVIAIGLAPWLDAFLRSVRLVSNGVPHRVFEQAWLDAGAALAYAAVSFSIGESLPAWLLAVAVVLVPAAVWLAARGGRERPPWLPLVIITGAIAFVGAHSWVSYAFVAGRLLFLLPFWLLLLVLGGRRAPRLRTAVCAALLLASAAGIDAYFGQSGFLNKAYVIPAAAIRDAIRERTAGAPAVLVLDDSNVPIAVPGLRTIRIADRRAFDEVLQLADGRAELVWFVRAAHDGSREAWSARVEQAFAPRFTLRRRGFVPYSAFDRWLMGLAGWPERPSHVVELIEMRARRGG